MNLKNESEKNTTEITALAGLPGISEFTSYFSTFPKAIIPFMIENYVIKKFDSQGFACGF